MTYARVLTLSTLAMILCGLAAGQTPVQCGSVITSNLTLTADLNCPISKDYDFALMVGASNVTVDLNGYSIIGAGNRKGIGIMVVSKNNVTIRNGEIRGFMIGVFVTTANNVPNFNTVATKLRLVGNQTGLDFDTVWFGEVSNVEAANNAWFGMMLWQDTRFTVASGNRVVNNAWIGLFLGCSPPFAGPADNTSAWCDAHRATQNTVENNLIVGNGSSVLFGSAAGMGIQFADNNLVRGNVVLNNLSNAPEGKNLTYGIVLWSSNRNEVQSNYVVNNDSGIAVVRSGSVPFMYSSDNNISGNASSLNAAAGIMIGEAEDTSNTVQGSYLAMNGWAKTTALRIQCRSGLCAYGNGTKIMDNSMYDNVECGIWANSNITLGPSWGNHADRNGDPGQCSGIACN